MTSIVSSLKQAVSSKDPVSSVSPKSGGSVLASPSFSDFSLCAHTDAAAEYHTCDEATVSPSRASLDAARPPSSPRWAYMFGSASEPRQILKGQAKELQDTSTELSQSQSLPRSQEGKIGGMSYYDYCELIRSHSSL